MELCHLRLNILYHRFNRPCPGGIWKRRFYSENASNDFCPRNAGGIKKTLQSAAILDLCLRKTRSGKSHDYRDVTVSEKPRFQNVSRPHENAKPAFSNSSGLKSVFEKLDKCGNKAEFANSSIVVWTGPKRLLLAC